MEHKQFWKVRLWVQASQPKEKERQTEREEGRDEERKEGRNLKPVVGEKRRKLKRARPRPCYHGREMSYLDGVVRGKRLGLPLAQIDFQMSCSLGDC